GRMRSRRRRFRPRTRCCGLPMRSSARSWRGGGTGAPPRLAVLAPRATRRPTRPPDGCTRARELRARLGGAPVPPRTAMLAGVLVLPIFISAAIAATGRISVPADVTAVGAVVRLGDVALLDGGAAGCGDVSLGAASAAAVVQAGDRPLFGRVRHGVEFAVNQRPANSNWVTADVGVDGSVVVATRAVVRGETLGAGDVAAERRDLSQLGRGIMTDPGEVAGRIARTPLVPYTPVRREQLDLPADVHRGEVA